MVEPSVRPEVLQVRRGTAFAEAGPLAPELLAMTGISHLHITGIALAVSAEARAAVALLDATETHGVTISFGPACGSGCGGTTTTSELPSIASPADPHRAPSPRRRGLLTDPTEPEAIADFFYFEAGAAEVVVKLGTAGAQA